MPTEASNETTKSSIYRMRVNINGFDLKNINVEILPVLTKTTQQNIQCQVKITGFRIDASNHNQNEDKKYNSEEKSRAYTKTYDILSRYHVDEQSMTYFLDPKNDYYLIVEFKAMIDEDVSVKLDDSIESVVELAAKCLLNVRDIEDLRQLIENPDVANLNFNHNNQIGSVIKDIKASVDTRFTPIKIINNKGENKFVEIKLKVPQAIRSASIEPYKPRNAETIDIFNVQNHLEIRFDGINLLLIAETTNGTNSTTIFEKEITLPLGTVTKKMTYELNPNENYVFMKAPVVNLK
jgi:hypothetical protein